jgi:hypothetical protein
MNHVDWLPWLAAVTLLGGGERNAWPRLLQALILAQVRSRGVLDDDPFAKPVVSRVGLQDDEPVEIPSILWTEWPFNPLKGWLIRRGYEHTRIPVGFVDVRFFRPDVEALALSAPAAEVATKDGRQQTVAKKRGPTLAQRLADELKTMFPDGRPAKRVEEIRRDLQTRPGVGNFGQRTLEEALKQAWQKGPQRSASAARSA